MLEGPSSQTLAGAVGWGPKAASWRDGQLLAESIPVVSGRLEAVTSSKVPERVTFTVPEASMVAGRSFSWVPGDDPAHPLAKYGQTIDLAVEVRPSLAATASLTRRGRFRIHDWDYDDEAGQVTVTALGVLKRVQEDGFTTPEVPRAGGTLGSEFRRLMPPGIPVYIHPGLVDRPCPRSFQWSQDRLDALYEIAEAWPARLRTDQWGQVQLLPPLPAVPTPVLHFTDGEGGTLISAPRHDTRAGLHNVVVGTSTATDSAAQDPIRAVAAVSHGPLKVTSDGTGYGAVTRYWSSPLAVTKGQLQASVDTLLADASRPAVVRTVFCAPDPRVDLDDPVAATKDGVTDWGFVVAYELPLTYRDGAMRIDIGVTS